MVGIFTIILLGLGGLSLGQEDRGNQIVFTYMGETTRESAYAHLVIPIDINPIEKAMDTLYDMVNTVARFSRASDINEWKSVDLYNVRRLINRITILTSLAHKEGFLYQPFQHDDQNEVKAAFGTRARSRRSVTTVIAAATGLAAFGSSIFN